MIHTIENQKISDLYLIKFQGLKMVNQAKLDT